MTIKEMTDKIIEHKNRDFLLISPEVIHNKQCLVKDYKSLQLYEAKEEITKHFAEEKIVNFNSSNKVGEFLSFHIVYCGNFKDLDQHMDFASLLEQQKEKLILIYSPPDDIEEENYFMGVRGTKRMNYDNTIYLDYSLLLSLLEENDICMKPYDTKSTSYYEDDSATTFILSKVKKKQDQDSILKKTKK